MSRSLSRVSSLLYVVMLLTMLARTIGEMVSGSFTLVIICFMSSSESADSDNAVLEMKALVVAAVAAGGSASRGVLGGGVSGGASFGRALVLVDFFADFLLEVIAFSTSRVWVLAFSLPIR